jgi:hypothetical protein
MVENKTTKKVYVSPELTVYGDVNVITLGNADGNFTDQLFPDGTPKNELTFS